MNEYTAVITIGIKAERDQHAEHIVDQILDKVLTSVNVTDHHASLWIESGSGIRVPVCEWKSR
jgi:hypothetical protein